MQYPVGTITPSTTFRFLCVFSDATTSRGSRTTWITRACGKCRQM